MVQLYLKCTSTSKPYLPRRLGKLELEIEEISNENEEMNSKLIDKDRDFNALQRKYKKEKKVSGMKESQKKKGFMCHSRMRNRNGNKFMYG